MIYSFRAFLGASILLGASFGLAHAESSVSIDNSTFTLEEGATGVPNGWEGYPPPNGTSTIIEEASGGGMRMVDKDMGNGLGVYQWVTVTPGHKYRFSLDVAGTGGCLFQVAMLPKRVGKIPMVKTQNVNNVQEWAGAGSVKTIDIVAPASAKLAWVWVYTPKKTDGDIDIVIKSISGEDLGEASADELAKYTKTASSGGGSSESYKPRPPQETIKAGTISVIDFETGDFSQARYLEGGKKEVVTAPEPVRAGTHSAKLQMTHDQHRTEVSSFRSKPYGEAKYGWSIYLPEDFDSSTWFSIVTQWHDWGSGKKYKFPKPSPPTSLNISGDAWQFKLAFQEGDTDNAEFKFWQLGSVKPDLGKWTDFVMEVNWQSPQTGGGYLKLYKNGELVVDYTGPTWYDDKLDGPYFKAGMYKGGSYWKGEESQAILYIDEMRMGDETSTYADVDPAQPR